MGDLSTEPSMEEILSSIKRIIAEEGDGPSRARRPIRSAARSARDEGEVLELSDPMPIERDRDAEAAAVEPARAPAPEAATEAPRVEAPALKPELAVPEPIVSAQTAEATRDALGHLSRLLVKPEPATEGTLEGLVRELLRPMLRDWLDAKLPAMVEDMVAREISKITGRPV